MSINLVTVNVNYINVNDPVEIAERNIESVVLKWEKDKKFDDLMKGIFKTLFFCCSESVCTTEKNEILDPFKKKGFEALRMQLKNFTIPSELIGKMTQDQRVYIITQQILLARITAFNLLLLEQFENMDFKCCAEEIQEQLDRLIILDQRFILKKKELGVEDLTGKRINRFPSALEDEERLKEIFGLICVSTHQLETYQKELEEQDQTSPLRIESQDKLSLNYDEFRKTILEKSAESSSISDKMTIGGFTAFKIYESLRRKLNEKNVISMKLNKANVQLAKECDKINSILEPLKSKNTEISQAPRGDFMDDSYFNVNFNNIDSDIEQERVSLIPKAKSRQHLF